MRTDKLQLHDITIGQLALRIGGSKTALLNASMVSPLSPVSDNQTHRTHHLEQFVSTGTTTWQALKLMVQRGL